MMRVDHVRVADRPGQLGGHRVGGVTPQQAVPPRHPHPQAAGLAAAEVAGLYRAANFPTWDDTARRLFAGLRAVVEEARSGRVPSGAV
jgi:uncharacterized protein YbbC (DUF1343 family)